MLDDTVEKYVGREAEWAALCAFDGVEAYEIFPDPSEAEALLSEVWEFVSATCEEAGQPTPELGEAANILAVFLVNRKSG